MERSIRKSTSLISVSYIDGSSSDLLGRNFQIEITTDGILFSIDFSENLKVRNSANNFFSDAIELREQIGDLSSLQIDEDQVVFGIMKVLQRAPDKPMFLLLDLGSGHPSRFIVEPQFEKHHLFLRIRKETT